jgi:hypothetical protein
MSLILSGTDGLSDVDGTAATPAIRGTDTNTGIFFPAADTIAFSEGGVEQMRLNSSGDLQMNSGYGSVATAFGCRAWVNFNGTGTVAIRASGNVSSITDNGTGNYTVNFTTSLSANPCAVASCNNQAANTNFGINVNGVSSASVNLFCVESGIPTDKSEINVSVFR